MPSSPISGISLIIYVVILAIGGFFRLLGRLGLNMSPVYRVFSLFIDEKHDSRERRFSGYAVSVLITFLLCISALNAVIAYLPVGGGYPTFSLDKISQDIKENYFLAALR
jgi:hypothetical protein